MSVLLRRHVPRAEEVDVENDAWTWWSASDAMWRWLLRGATVATCAPLWIGKHLPMADLPEHVATIATLRHFWDTNVQSTYRLLPATEMQYVLYHAIGAVLAIAFGPERANLLLLTLVAAGLPYGMRAVLRAMKHDDRLALFGCVLVWNFSFVTGFFNYVAALPIMLYAIAATIRHAEQPRRSRALWIAFLGIVLFYLHVSALAFFAIAAALLMWLLPEPPEARALVRRLARLPRKLVFLAPSIGLFLMWSISSRVVRGAMATTPPVYRTVSESLRALPEALLDVWKGSHDEHVALAALGIAIVLGWPQRRDIEEREHRWRRSVVLLLGLVAGVLYFVLPHQRGAGSFIGHRYAIIAALFFPLALRPAQGRAAALPFAALAAIAVWAGFVHASEIRAFDREVGDFDALIARAEPNKRLLGLMFDSESRTAKFPPFVHFGGYYRARKGGVAAMTFSEFSHFPIQFRPSAAPPAEREGWEWNPCVFRNAREGAYYDYVLTRGTVNPFASRPAGPEWKLVATQGKMSLYEKVAGAVLPLGDAEDPGPCSGSSIAEASASLNRFVEVAGLTMQIHEVSRREYSMHLDRLSPDARRSAMPLDDSFGQEAANDALPVTWVTHDHAAGYCRAIGARLPTSHEWSRVASTVYPAAFDGTNGPHIVREVASEPRDRTRAGVMDLVGNVREWTGTIMPGGRVVVRGGDANTLLGHDEIEIPMFLATPTSAPAIETAGALVGFRCVR